MVFGFVIASVDVTQNISGLAYCGGYTLRSSLTFRFTIENIFTLHQSKMISDHKLISFELCLSHDALCAFHLPTTLHVQSHWLLYPAFFKNLPNL